MKTLRTISVPASALAAVVAEVDNVQQVLDAVQVTDPGPSLEEQVRIQGETLRNVRTQLRELRRQITRLCGTNDHETLPAIVISNLQAHNNLKKAYAQAQALYSPGTLDTEFDPKTGSALAAALVKLFSVAGYDCRNWNTYLEQHSLAPT